MKFDFHIRAAAEIPVAEALRPQMGTEMTAKGRCTASQPAPRRANRCPSPLCP